MGTHADSSQSFSALFALAQLRPTMTRIISSNSVLPLIETKKLYVRESYTDLYKHIKQNLFQDNPLMNRLVITGTSGIGKSAFLLYLILQLFVETTSNSPIIIFHSEKWHAFGGTTALRVGNREDFEPFLRLPDAWYLADSPSEPLTEDVTTRTLFSVSPNKHLQFRKSILQGPSETRHPTILYGSLGSRRTAKLPRVCVSIFEG